MGRGRTTAAAARGALVVCLAAVGLVAPAASTFAADDRPASVLTLVVPDGASDRATVPVEVDWRATDGTPLDGRVLLELQRTGTTDWVTRGGVDVVDGHGRTTDVATDDGLYRLRAEADGAGTDVVSDPRPFDHRPTRRLVMRLGQLNLPGPDKIGRSTERAARAASRIRRFDLDVVTFNELVGSELDDAGRRRASAFATTVRSALGSRWRMVTPTTGYNENYVMYRADRVELLAQMPDRIVPGVGTDGVVRARTARHVTTVLLKDLPSNRPFLVAGTHLVSGDRDGARTQAATVGDEVERRSAGYPAVVAGDMNTAELLAPMTSRGLVDARRVARDRTRERWSTHTTYSAARPRRDAAWIIDQVYVPATWVARRWYTDLDLDGDRFRRPRASDHALVWTEVVGGS